MRWMFKVVGFVCMVPIVYWAVVRYWPDLPPPDDSDLVVKWEPVPHEENAWPLLEELESQMVPLDFRAHPQFQKKLNDRKFKNLTEEELYLWRQLVASNSPAYAIIQRINDKPFVAAIEAPSIDSELPPFNESRFIISLRGDLAAVEENADAFVSHHAEIQAYCAQIREVGWLVVMVIALSYERMLDQSLLLFLERGDSPDILQALKPLIELRADRRAPIEAWQMAWRYEYLLFCSGLEHVKAGTYLETENEKLNALFLVKMNRAKSKVVPVYRAAIETTKHTYGDADWSVIRKKDESIGNRPWWTLFGSLTPITDPMEAILIPGFEFITQVLWRGEFRWRATTTALALRLYELVHGELPETLDDLVPEYLPEVPIDPYDGEPMRYSRERRILWSVGKDLKDNGGSDAPAREKLYDLDEPPSCYRGFPLPRM